NRHHFPSFTLQAVCDRRKRFVDVFTGHPSKVHDGRVFRTSSIAAKLPQICSRIFNAKFLGTRVLIENAFADLKNRFRRLKQLEFWGVDFSTKFIIAYCVLHNLCIDGGDDTVEEDEDDSALQSAECRTKMKIFPMKLACESVASRSEGRCLRRWAS
ncbi:unnamed protein product, partial [Ixodes pacificus]